LPGGNEEDHEYFVRFQVLTAASMKFRFVFWDVMPCKIIVDRRFRGTCCLHHQSTGLLYNSDPFAQGSLIALMMEAARTSETSDDSNFTRHYIPEHNSESPNCSLSDRDELLREWKDKIEVRMGTVFKQITNQTIKFQHKIIRIN
jgi:hypothetical protein